jgi:hypothetical protein
MNIDQLNQLLSYDAETGDLLWKKKPSKNISVGALAGHKSKIGYIQIGIGGKLYLGHRIAWSIFYNEQPPKIIDHINGNKGDNSIKNLRGSTNSENMSNMGRTKKNSTGFKGVTFNKKLNKYMASIGHNMKSIYLGLHDTPEKAHEAYCEAAKKLHGQFAKISP